MNGVGAREGFPSADDDVDVERIELDEPRSAAGLLGSDQRCARAAETIDHDVAAMADIAYGVGYKRHGLRRRVGLQFSVASLPEGVAAGILPPIGAIPATLAKAKIIAVRCRSHLE